MKLLHLAVLYGMSGAWTCAEWLGMSCATCSLGRARGGACRDAWEHRISPMRFQGIDMGLARGVIKDAIRHTVIDASERRGRR
jgi:hypothetical protein